MNFIDFAIFSNLFFNGYVFFQQPFEFYITYLPIVILLPVFFLKFKFPKELLFFLLPLLAAGMLNVLLDNNTVWNFFKIFANIAINVVFYRYVMEYYEFDIKKMIRFYLAGSFIVSCIGLFQLFCFWINFHAGYNWLIWLPLNKWGVVPGGLGIRINSTFSEPSNLGLSMAPAFFLSIYTLIRWDNLFLKTYQAVVIVVVYLLSFSSLAYIGIAFTILFLMINFGLIRYIFIAVPVTIFLFSIAYNNVPEFKVRLEGVKALFIDDILSANAPRRETKTQKQVRIKKILLQTHGSSFVLYNNAHIAFENFKRNPLFGSGLGSQELAFQEFNLNYIIGDIYRFNPADANSMFLRILSEVGLMGILFILIFIYKAYISKDLSSDEPEEYWLICNALLVLILAQLIRQGNYTFGGFFFYGWMYYYNYINYINYRINQVGFVKTKGKSK